MSSSPGGFGSLKNKIKKCVNKNQNYSSRKCYCVLVEPSR
jgi:hypothetical protein